MPIAVEACRRKLPTSSTNLQLCSFVIRQDFLEVAGRSRYDRRYPVVLGLPLSGKNIQQALPCHFN